MATIIPLVVAALPRGGPHLVWSGSSVRGAWALKNILGRFAPTARILAPRAQRVYTARLPVFQLGCSIPARVECDLGRDGPVLSTRASGASSATP